MSSYGKVIECRVLAPDRKIDTPRSTLDDPNSKYRGVGFCRFDTHDNAQAAINGLHGNVPRGSTNKLNVKLADPPKDVRRGFAYATTNGNNNNNNDYRYSQYGQRNSYGYGSGGGSSPIYTGYGVPYSPPLSYQNYNGRKSGSMTMNYSGSNSPRTQSYPGVCLFIYHLTPDCNEHTLQQLFSNYGTVLSAKVMKDLHTGRNKGFGFVNMMNDQQAQLAISSLNGYQMGLNFLKVSYKK